MASNVKIIDVCDVLRGDKVIDFYMMFFFVVIRLMELRCVNGEAACALVARMFCSIHLCDIRTSGVVLPSQSL
jgi:hypothetical protein